MKKYFVYLFSGILVIVICFFSLNIFLKKYFNQRFYSLPNLVGLTINDTKNIDLINKIQISVAGNEFSELPAGTIFMQNPAPNKLVKEGRNIRVWISKGKDTYTVPDFLNKNFIDVSPELQKEGVKIKQKSYTYSNLPYNTIIATYPATGEMTKRSEGVSFLLSKSNTVSSIIVPDTVGFTINEATNELTSKGLIIGEVTEQIIPGLEKGIVIDTTYIGESVPAGTIINMTISY